VESYYTLEARISVPRRGRPIFTFYRERRDASTSWSPHGDLGEEPPGVRPSVPQEGRLQISVSVAAEPRPAREKRFESALAGSRRLTTSSKRGVSSRGISVSHEGPERYRSLRGAIGFQPGKNALSLVERKDRGIDLKDCSRRLAIAWSGQRRVCTSASFLRD
jgi:hypothetical protein